MIHNISRFIAALALILLTAQTAGAQTVSNVPYIDADGNEQTATYATVVTSDMGGTSADNFSRGNGWYYVNSDVTLNGAYNTSTYTQNIILGDGATLTVSGLFRFQNASLNIYCQSGGTGRLVVSGSYGSNAIFSVTSGGTLTINGGTVEVTNTSNNGNGFNGNLVMNGGTATFTSNKGVTCYAITGSVTLNGGTFTATSGSWMGVCDKTVTIGDGKYFKDGSGNIYYGTLTDAQNNALNGVTLSPATKTEYIQACLGTGNDGSASKPYTISDAAGWDAFCLALQDNDTWNRFSGKTVQLGADITVTRMAGGSGHEFTGTFDGDGKTLTVNYTNNSNDVRTAPFSYVNGATIQNLIVGGTISGTAYRAAGIVGETPGQTTITNCVSSVDISSGRYTGGISIGGLVTITGCVFNGKIVGTTYSGGFVGYSNTATAISNSLFAPQDGSSISGGTFYFNGGGDVAPVNSYYTQALGTAQGKACHSVTAGTDVTIGAIALTGTATQYTVSGITAYSGGGLQLGETLYYGSDDQLSLTLNYTGTVSDGYTIGYTASAGTLSGTTLTMPDEDVTISAALAPIDWATVNEGDSADPYMIYNKDQLLLLAHRVNGTNGETANTYEGKYFKLGADITFSHDADETDDYAENYEAIGSGFRYFRGNFDGDNHTVSGIRIRKTGTGIANNYIGLFGQTGSANIHDVHLTDARIKGYSYVGGIVGYNSDRTTVSGCTVTDSYITATTTNSNYYGIICGYNNTGFYGGHLTNNYYHGCTVNGTAVTSGMGCGGSDLDDEDNNHGALPAYAITLGDGVSTTVLASEPENGFVKGGISYYRLGLALPLASEAPEGYTLSFSANGTALSGSTYTVNATDGDVTINTTLRSDGLEHEVNYMTADGTTQTAKAIALDGHETVDGAGDINLAAGTYYVGTDIAYANRIRPAGDITLILADGKTMTLNGKKQGIFNDGNNLTIYGQSLDDDAGTLRYDGSSVGIHAYNYEQHSGNVRITTTGLGVNGIYADVTLRGGTLTISANGDNACAINGYTLSILGGHLTATATGTDATGIYASANSGTAITLGWTNPNDRITASSISTNGGTVAVATGKALTDGSGNIYTGTLTASVLSGFAAETTLQPCLALADAADNTDAIDDHAGKTLAVALSGRTLYKDGSWNTLCLPFDVDLTATDCPLYGATARTVTAASISGSTLNLTFGDAVNTLVAGTPYIIKWDGDGTSNIENPVFEGVTIDATERNYDNGATGDARVRFCGTYKSTAFDSEDKSILLMGEENTLFYPAEGAGIGSCRAYFKIGDNGVLLARRLTSFSINFDDDDSATGIIDSLSPTLSQEEGAWYSIDGRKLVGKPTQHGIYINNGKKVVIK